MNYSNTVPGLNKVNFKSQGENLVGNLYTPEDFDSGNNYPTVLYSGPFNQVKEQTGDVYGRKMAAKGYIFLSFDHLGYGDSEGVVRNYENPSIKMESIRDAVSYLRTLPFVNVDKLYGLGVCASGGYMTIVATTDKRIKAVATVSGMMNNTAGYFGTMTKEQLMPLFKAANDARQKTYETGQVDYYDALGLEMDADAFNALPIDSAQYEGVDFYMTGRGGAQTYPRYDHKAPMFLMEQSPIANAVAIAPFLYTPYLGIIGGKAETGVLTQMIYDAASEPKELYVVDGASHVSLYDIDRDVAQAVDKMHEFYSKH